MAITNNTTVLGVFRDHSLAEAAAHELQQAGFSDDQITLLEKHDNALGGLRNLFATHSSHTPPSTDMLNDLNLAETSKDYYQREVDAGNAVLLVQAGDRMQEAHTILYRHGAYNAESTPLEMGGTGVIPIRHEELVVNKEVVPIGEIRVHKRIITEQKTFTIPVTREELIIEHIPFTNGPSHIQIDQPNTLIERHPTEATNAAQTQFAQAAQTPAAVTDNTISDEALRDGGTLRIVLHEDQVTINKQTVVREEILIRKDLIEETRQLSGAVKHEEVRVTRHGKAIVHNKGIDVAEEINEAGA